MQISVSDFHTLITTFFILNQKVYFVNRKAWNPWDKGLTLWFLFCFPHTLITNQLLYRLSYTSIKSIWTLSKATDTASDKINHITVFLQRQHLFPFQLICTLPCILRLGFLQDILQKYQSPFIASRRIL